MRVFIPNFLILIVNQANIFAYKISDIKKSLRRVKDYQRIFVWLFSVLFIDLVKLILATV
jgi:hypothetical protein